MKWFQFIFQWFSIVDLHSFHHNISYKLDRFARWGKYLVADGDAATDEGAAWGRGLYRNIRIFETAHVSPQVRNRVYTFILELSFDFI